MNLLIVSHGVVRGKMEEPVMSPQAADQTGVVGSAFFCVPECVVPSCVLRPLTSTAASAVMNRKAVIFLMRSMGLGRK